MAAMTTLKEQSGSLGSLGPAPRLPTLPICNGRMATDALSEKVGNSGGQADRLPVVEICPFMHQEWRPSRSLPDYYGRVDTSMSDRSSQKDSVSGYLDTAQLSRLNTSKSAELGSRNTLLGYRRENSRLRSKEGKPVDTSHSGMFITANDRERNTMKDVQSAMIGEFGPSTQTASIKRSLSEGQLVQQREMHVHGRRLDNLPPKVSMIYMSPWEYYRMNRCYHIPMADQENAQSMSINTIRATQQSTRSTQHVPITITDLENQFQALGNVYIDDNIYDQFDRANTLPSIRVTNTKPQKRPQGLQVHSSAGLSNVDVSAPGSSKSSVYRLGVANSLDVLRHFGKPARVENHLAMHLKHTLSQLRRKQDPQSSLQGLTSASLQQTMASAKPAGLRMSSTPTFGEAMIRAGIEANNKKTNDRNICTAQPSKSAPGALSHPIRNGKREIHEMHLDEEDKLAQVNKYLRLRMEADMQTEALQLTNIPHTFAEQAVKPRQVQEDGTHGEATLPRYSSYDPKSPHSDQDPQDSTSPQEGEQEPRIRRSRQDNMCSVVESIEEETATTQYSSGVITPGNSEGGHSVKPRDSHSGNEAQSNIYSRSNTRDGLSGEDVSSGRIHGSVDDGTASYSRGKATGVIEIPQVSAGGHILNDLENDGSGVNEMRNEGSTEGSKPSSPNPSMAVIATNGGGAAIPLRDSFVEAEEIDMTGDQLLHSAETTNRDLNNNTNGNTGGRQAVQDGNNPATGMANPGGVDADAAQEHSVTRSASRFHSPQQPVVAAGDAAGDVAGDTVGDAAGDTGDAAGDAAGYPAEGAAGEASKKAGRDAAEDAAEHLPGDAAGGKYRALEDGSEPSALPSGADPAQSAHTLDDSNMSPVPQPPEGEVTAKQKVHTKSATSKTSSSGFHGDTIYLTNWDQHTDCESPWPETVLTIREESKLEPEPE